MKTHNAMSRVQDGSNAILFRTYIHTRGYTSRPDSEALKGSEHDEECPDTSESREPMTRDS